MKDKFRLYKLMQNEPPMLIKAYTLEGHTPVLATSLLAWAHQFECSNCRVKEETINIAPWYKKLLGLHEDYWVSTVFFGVDSSFLKNDPLIFETMIFETNDGEVLNYRTRCATWSEAISMHYAAKKWLLEK